jgi:hypothetical protein
MIAVKDGRVLRSTGLTGSCAFVAAIADGSELDACKPGKLEGRPDLSRRGCTGVAVTGGLQYWHCPADLRASNAGR